jgi:hypothetical protein
MDGLAAGAPPNAARAIRHEISRIALDIEFGGDDGDTGDMV